MDSTTKLKRVVIKEELVALTGDYMKALILNQFLYWSERTRDFDRFIAEEQARAGIEDKDLQIEPTEGWIYKTASDLNNELMLGVSPNTIRRHLTKLVEAGYIDQRRNPDHKWDRTWQYRPNIIAIQTDLDAMGFALDGYPLIARANSTVTVATDNLTIQSEDLAIQNVKVSVQNEHFDDAIPEITTETTTEITTEKTNTLPTANDKNAKKPLSPTELSQLITFGQINPTQGKNDIDLEIEDSINRSGWVLDDPHERQALIDYLVAGKQTGTYIHIPQDESQRKLWRIGLRQHVANFPLGKLRGMYVEAFRIAKGENGNGGFKVTHPKALTKTLGGIDPEVADGRPVADMPALEF